MEKGQTKGRFFAPDKLENLSQYRKKKKGEKTYKIKKREEEKKKQRLHFWFLYWLH